MTQVPLRTSSMMETCRVGYQAFKGQALTGEPTIWAMKYGLNRSARFDLDVYTEAGASIMARAWCHRMECHYRVYVEAAGSSYVYTPNDHEGYSEPADFVALAEDAAGRVAALVEQLRLIEPSRPLH